MLKIGDIVRLPDDDQPYELVRLVTKQGNAERPSYSRAVLAYRNPANGCIVRFSVNATLIEAKEADT